MTNHKGTVGKICFEWDAGLTDREKIEYIITGINAYPGIEARRGGHNGFANHLVVTLKDGSMYEKVLAQLDDLLAR